MTRLLDDWIQGYMVYVGGQESPERFHIWGAVSAIAATSERYVYLDRGFYTLYPNLYIVIVSDSAVARKSTAIIIASKLARAASPDINFVSQKITPQALITEFHKQFKQTNVSSAYIVVDELALFLGTSIQDATMVHVLTKAYTSDDYCDYHTIARGRETCNNMCVNLLGGTTPEWVKSSLPPYALAGGFAGRIVFVYHGGAGTMNAYPMLSPEQVRMKELLVRDLSQIRRLRGAFKMTPEAREWFRVWYEEVFQTFLRDTHPFLKSYYGRKHDTLLKIAMTLSMSKGDSLTISEEDLVDGLGLLNENEKYLPAIMEKIQSSDVGDNNMKVLSHINRKTGEKGDGPGISYSELLRNLSYCLSAKDVRTILDGLLASELITEDIPPGKKAPIFKAKKRRWEDGAR